MTDLLIEFNSFLAQADSLFRISAAYDKSIGTVLLLSRLITKCGLSPRRNGAGATNRCLAVTTTMGVIYGVHCGTSDSRTDTQVTGLTSFTKLNVCTVDVTNLTPVAFLVIKESTVRVLPIPAPANTTADRIVEQVPDVLDKLADFIDSRMEKKGE